MGTAWALTATNNKLRSWHTRGHKSNEHVDLSVCTIDTSFGKGQTSESCSLQLKDAINNREDLNIRIWNLQNVANEVVLDEPSSLEHFDRWRPGR